MGSNFQGFFHAELARIQGEFPDLTETPAAFKILSPTHFFESNLVPGRIWEFWNILFCDNLKGEIFKFNLELIWAEFLINFCGFGI